MVIPWYSGCIRWLYHGTVVVLDGYTMVQWLYLMVIPWYSGCIRWLYHGTVVVLDGYTMVQWL